MRVLITLTVFVTMVMHHLLAAEIVNNADYISISSRNITVKYLIDQVEDGFGNVRQVKVSGIVENNSNQVVSSIRVNITFELTNRGFVERSVRTTNLMPNSSKPFNIELDYGTQPDALKNVVCSIEQVLFAATREPSVLTPYHLVTHEFYTLPRLNEEGRAFMRVLQYIRDIKPFQPPMKDEFETTTEYEARVNNAENEHFFKMMDDLETRYGLLIGGPDTRIRFLPRIFRDQIIYLSECSANFNVRIGLGRYNADLEQFDNLSMNPRTVPFPPRTYVPQNDLQFIHRSGLFFLRSAEYKVGRQEAQVWRLQDQHIILDVTVRFGVRQVGPDIQEFCIIEGLILKNKETGEVFREWHIGS